MAQAQQSKYILNNLYYTAINSVNGCTVVEKQLQRSPIEGDVAVVAIGKAAAAMMEGAEKLLNKQIQSALIITKIGYAGKSTWPCIESGHPIPDSQSLEAGYNLLNFIKNIPKGTRFLALISGGASSLVEVLPENMDLGLLQQLTQWLLGGGLSIHEMNQIRQSVSLIKGGKALNYLAQNEMTQFLISDVKNDDIEVIGSGLFVAKKTETATFSALPDWVKEHVQQPQPVAKVSVESHVVASNDMACQAVLEHAKQANYEVIYHGQSLYGDVFELADSLVKELIEAKAGVHIWGGETTLILPDKPGRGGRNQSLALALACLLENKKGITVLVGATDGSDGPTGDTGAIIDGSTLQRGTLHQESSLLKASDYLKAADAGTFLAAAGDLISTGPTGTNVMDIVIALKEPI